MNASSKVSAAFSHCVNQVRSYEYHHYLCLLELPSPATRRAAFALRSFNVEVSKAMDVASNPKIGLMRLLFWRDALEKNFSSIDHPTAIALSESIGGKNSTSIVKTWLRRSIEARIEDANREPDEIPRRIKDLENYGEKTASNLLYATLNSAGITSSAADHAASHIGKASSLLLLLRSIPFHASRGRERFYLPLELAEKHGLKLGSSLNDCREILSDVVFEMALVAEDHLRRARDLAATVPKEALPVLLPAVAAKTSLDGLRKVNFDVFDPRINRGVLGSPPLWFQLKLKWHSLRGKY